MTTWERVKGDKDDVIIPIIDGVADLVNVTAVVSHVWNATTASVNLTTTVLSATERTLTVQLGGAAGWLAVVATPGAWNVEYETTWADGSILTWPAGRPDVIVVRGQGG